MQSTRKQELEKKKMDVSELDSRVFDGFAEYVRGRYIYLCNMSTGVSRWSRSAVEEFALPGEYMQNAAEIWEEHIHPEDREKYAKDIQEVFAGKKDRHDMDYRARNAAGEYVMCTCRGTVIKGTEGAPSLFLGCIENHSIKDNVDSVTSLYNVYEFWNYVHELKKKQQTAQMLFIGINYFDQINATYGYDFGDKVLRRAGECICEVLQPGTRIFRMDGVKFACCFQEKSEEELEAVYEKLRSRLRQGVSAEGIAISLNVSGGLLFFDEHHEEATVQAGARFVLALSKKKHYGELVRFDNTMLSDNRRNLELMNAIRTSVLHDCSGFYLCYQPIVNAEDEHLIGVEALLRWQQEPFGEVPPGMFLPWLENDPCFWELGKWILKTGMQETKPLLEKYPEMIVNINIAYPQMSHSHFCEMVTQILEETGFPKERLCLELTERCRQLDKEHLHRVVDYMNTIGVKIAIDDFGTGFSSLNLLSELSVDTLKIDRGFIIDIETNTANQAIVEAVTACAGKLDVNVCMEGMETKEMIDFVRKYNIYSFQGYYYSKPVRMEKLLEKYQAKEKD